MLSVNEKASLCEDLIDDMCETYGVRKTIAHLFNYLDSDQIVGLGFDKEDVDIVYEEYVKENEYIISPYR